MNNVAIFIKQIFLQVERRSKKMKTKNRNWISLAFIMVFLVAACTSGLSGLTGGSSSNTGSSGGKVALPTNTVDNQSGQVYAIGQAVKDPTTGAVVLVNSITYNNSLPGLAAGETWALINITIGNAGTETITYSSIASFYVKSSSTGQTYGMPLSALVDLLASNIINSNNSLDQDVAPNTAYQGLLPVKLSASATGLTLVVSPVTTSAGATIDFSLGK